MTNSHMWLVATVLDTADIKGSMRKKIPYRLSMNDVTALGGRRYPGFCDDNTQKRDDGRRGSKIIKSYVTSFIDDPFQ